VPCADIRGDPMVADVDALYQNLSNVVKSHGRSLNQLAESAKSPKDTYLKLADCCWFVRNEKPRHANIDPFNYLGTFNEYAERTNRTPSKIWENLQKGSHNKFLDTLVEAVWDIHFTKKGLVVRPDVPMNSKDVDFVITTLKGKEWWLDAYSVGPEKLNAPLITCNLHQCVGRRTIQSDRPLVVEKVRKKYNEKFKEAVSLGLLNDKSAGILLCVMKEHSPLVIGRIADIPEPAPLNFFNNKPGLDLVWIHTLGPLEGQDVLQPRVLYEWWRDGLISRLDDKRCFDNHYINITNP